MDPVRLNAPLLMFAGVLPRQTGQNDEYDESSEDEYNPSSEDSDCDSESSFCYYSSSDESSDEEEQQNKEDSEEELSDYRGISVSDFEEFSDDESDEEEKKK